MTIFIPGMWPYDASILGDGPGTPRIRAVSVVLAAQASSFSEVSDFRRQYLKGSLLPADQIDTWLMTLPESKRESAAYWLCNIPVEHLKRVDDGSYIIPPEIMRQALHNQRDDNEKPSARKRTLYYATPQREWMGEPIRATDGVLDTLRTVARGLVEFYTPVAPAGMGVQSLWKEELAVTFILTGYAPLVPEDAFPLPARSGRRQTEKHLQLAAFKAHHEALHTPPAEQLAIWNARFPQWAYKNTTNFGWDSRQAVARQPRYTAEEVATAIEEKRRQQGGRKSAIWGSEVGVLLEDAKRRGETEKTEKTEKDVG